LVSVTVCDNQGHLIAVNRMDGAFSESDRFSIGKAIASAATGLPSDQIEGMVFHASAEIAVAEGMPVYRVRGGLPIFRDGQVAGGCGVDERRHMSKRKNVLPPVSPIFPARAQAAVLAMPQPTASATAQPSYLSSCRRCPL
jgi:Haem-degrading